MDSGEEAISEEYESSLEDLTFNSKPLINVLTMLAEENSQFASSITNLIANRIRQVQQQYKLPSLYLLDSIVKNVGGDYLHLVAQILEETFTCVFEKADEKSRRDLYKLRHTWSQYFPAKLLYELDVAVNKHDPGWPIPSVPPPSPSIHVNPKFLKKTDGTGGVASLTTEISTPQEHQVVEGHQQRLVELERLQQEQLKLTELEIQEHQMKRDLLLKKQQQERKLLLQQQQQDILRLRLNTDDSESTLSNGPPSSTAQLPVSTKAESTESVQKTFSSRDPRLRRSEQEPDRIQESRPVVVEEMLLSKPVINKKRMVVDNQESVPLPMNSLQFEQTTGRPPEHVTLPQRNREVDQNQGIRNLQHMTFVENPAKPVAHLDKEVTGSPKYGDIQKESKPKRNHRRRNSGDWPSHPASFEKFLDEPPVSKTQSGRGKPRKTRRGSAERQREKGRGGRDRGHERNRDPGNERFQNPVFENDQRFVRRAEQTDSRYAGDRPVDSSPFRGDWNSDVEYRDENFRPHSEPPSRRGKWRRGKTVYVRGRDHDEIMRARSPGVAEQRVRGMGRERDRIENMEPQFPGAEIHQDPDFRMREENRFHPREQNHPAFHNDPREQPVGEPLPKKPRPLLSDMEINELRNRKGASPNTGRMTPPLMLQEDFRNHPVESGEPPFPLHADGPFCPGFGPPPPGVQPEFAMYLPPMDERGEDWTPRFEIPRELMLDRENEIMRRAERRLQSGDLTADQHHDLVDKLHQLYDLQRQSELMRNPPDMQPRHTEHQPRHMIPIRPGEEAPMDIEVPPDAGPGRPMLPIYEEHARIPHRGPAPVDPQGPPMRHEGPRFEPNEPHMGRHNEDFRGHPVELDQHSHGRHMPLGPKEPPRRGAGSNPMFPHGRPLDDIPAPRTPPRQDRAGEVAPPTPNTMMEKQAVDDLFRKLMQVGIIKVTPEPGSESPRHAPSPGPPQAELQQPQPLPTRPVSEVLPILAAVMPKKELSIEKKTIPEIKLVPEELKRRHDLVITSLYEGTQCSSCGLRFPGEAAKIYREHLDWHFRKNRREKDSRRVAHRQWYFVVKDWLNYEEISDPDERARSSFFDVSTGAVDSPDPLKEAVDSGGGDGSCPVLSGDTEAEAECDICCEKFEQFWEETNEEWHYKAAVRIDGKTYHLLCYQDAKENQGHAEDDNDLDHEAEDSTDAGVDQTSPSKGGAKTHIKQEGDSKDKAKMAEKREASKINSMAERTDKSDAKSSEKDSCKMKGVGIEQKEKGSVGVPSNVVENKENETKGDDK